MTPETLHEAIGCSADRAAAWAEALTRAMEAHDISTPERQAAFLAQIGHESGRLKYVRELWGPTAAQKGYEGRADLGNTVPGDGFKYRGRGLIQTTGRHNYLKTGMALGLDLIEHPELLEQPENAANSAAWFWEEHGLNELADAGDFIRITRRINGGVNGLAERQALLQTATEALA